MNYTKRHSLTLIEIMLVIVLIGIVGGALAFNLRGALDKGKSFKTQETKKKIEAILSIASVDDDQDIVLGQWTEIVSKSPLIKVKLNNGTVVDAWGNPFEVKYEPSEGQYLVSSTKIDVDGKIVDNS